LGRAVETGGLIAAAAVVPLSAASAPVGVNSAREIAGPSPELSLVLTAAAFALLLATFALTSDAVIAREPRSLLAWTAGHRYDIRLTASGIAAAIVVGTLVARLGQGGPG